MPSDVALVEDPVVEVSNENEEAEASEESEANKVDEHGDYRSGVLKTKMADWVNGGFDVFRAKMAIF